MPRAGQVDHVGVGVLNQAVQMHVDEAEAGRGSPVTQQPRLDVLRPQRLAQQGVLLQVDLADRQVIGRLPVPMHVLQTVWIEVRHDVLLRGVLVRAMNDRLRFPLECKHRPLSALLYQLPGVPGDHQVFIGLHDPHGCRAAFPRNDGWHASRCGPVQSGCRETPGPHRCAGGRRRRVLRSLR